VILFYFCKWKRILIATAVKLLKYHRYGTNGVSKQLKTCNIYHQRFAQKWKRCAEINNCLPDDLEIIDIDYLTEVVMNLLEDISQNNQELYLHCANNIVELIEDADRYNWNYKKLYENKGTTTYFYYCSQREIMINKPRKHPDPSKQWDVPSMERFHCDGVIKISVDMTKQMFEVKLVHTNLHIRPINKSVPQDVKDFIKDNIDLLPREIYYRLVGYNHSTKSNLLLMVTVRTKSIQTLWRFIWFYVSLAIRE
jgi:hypothetical protein